MARDLLSCLMLTAIRVVSSEGRSEEPKGRGARASRGTAVLGKYPAEGFDAWVGVCGNRPNMNARTAAWYCVCTARRQESAVFTKLGQLRGFSVFLPRLRSRRPVGVSTTRLGVEPLFPQYLFARFELESGLARVSEVDGVKSVLRFGDHWPTIPDALMHELIGEFGSSQIIDRPIPRLEPGMHPDSWAGPLKGFRAVTHYDIPAAQRVQILLEILRRDATRPILRAPLESSLRPWRSISPGFSRRSTDL